MINAKKHLILILLIGLQAVSCNKDNSVSEEVDGQDTEQLGVNLDITTSGSYPATSDRIYVDEELKASSEDNAVFYLEKELLGRQLIPNDDPTFDYWKSKQYFQDTPIINYIYKYIDVNDGKLFFAANTSELEGTTHYIFDGLAIWAYKNDTVKVKTGYSIGKLDGDFIVYNQDGTVKTRYGYDKGRRYTNTQKEEDVYKPLIGLWEAELHNDGDFQLRTQVYDLKADGSMEFYHNIYYNNSSGTPPDWEITDYGDDTKVTGSWLYEPQTDSTGELTFYYKGETAQKNDVKQLSSGEMVMKATYTVSEFEDEYTSKELRFQKKESN